MWLQYRSCLYLAPIFWNHPEPKALVEDDKLSLFNDHFKFTKQTSGVPLPPLCFPSLIATHLMRNWDLQHELRNRPRDRVSLKHHLACYSSSAGCLTKLNCITAEILFMDFHTLPVFNSFFLPYRPTKVFHQQLHPFPTSCFNSSFLV